MGIRESRELLPGVITLRLSGPQVAKLRERFELISDSFGLGRDQVQLLYKAKPQELDLIFSLFDRANRGKIDAYEFISGMIILSDAELESKVETLFDLYDFDHSHNVTFDELIILMRSGMNALCCMTGGVPSNMQDLLSHTQTVFAKLDVNKDNQISIAEFLSFVTKDVEVMILLETLGLITSEDKRPNFGTEEEPEVDSDLENETKREFQRTVVQERVKGGVEVLDDTPFLLEQVGQGDQFMAVRPWEGVVRNSVPTNYRPTKGEDDPPDASLELEYIYGYRCHDCRNNVRYTATGEVVYHTAAVGIVLNPGTNSQKFFINHTDDIISFSANITGSIVATGEIGRNPLLYIWNTDTMSCIKSYQGILKKGITSVDISSDSCRVVALGADEDRCVVVYDIERKADKPGIMQGVIATGKCGRDTILDIRFSPADSNKIIACGVKVLQVLTVNGGSITTKRGIGWGKTPNTQLQTLLCVGFLGNSILTGGFNGCLIIWNESSLTNAVKIHESAITCIAPLKVTQGIITGGNDCFVHILNAQLNKTHSIDLRTLGSMLPKPRSVCQGNDGKFLIGTRGGEIYQFTTPTEGRAIMKGHFDKELWALACHPHKSEICTVGQDCMLALWDIPTRKQKAAVKVENSSMACSYSPDGTYIVIGCENGKIIIFDSGSLSVRLFKHDRTLAISTSNFTPDGRYLSVGAHDSMIFIYDTSNFSLKVKMRGHTSTVTHADFSVAGDVLQSVSKSYDLLYHDINTGKQNPSGASAYRNEAWHSWSCILGWPVQGIWPPCSDGSDINMVRRSKSHKVVATVDDFGQVKLFKYPCIKKGAGFNAYKGHSSHVTNCVFVGNYLMSTGGNDKAIFQWKYTEENLKEEIAEGAMEAALQENEFFTIESAGKGDQFMAVKPWLGEVANSAPNNYIPPKNQSKPPDSNLILTKVHGYRSFDSRNNLKYTSSGDIVYPAAALGVVMNVTSREQRFFTMHDDDVVCLSIHPNRKIAATGQMAHIGKSRSLELHVWDCETLESISVLTGFHRRAIRHVDFSPDGSKILSIGEDDDHSMAIYEWQQKRLVCTAKVDKDIVLGASFTSESECVVYGAKFIKFFGISGLNCNGQRGILGTNSGKFEAQMCGTVFGRSFVTGTHMGNLFIWNGRSLSKAIKGHEGQVWALCRSGENMLSGGSDGMILLWDPNMRKLQSVSVADYSLNPGVRSLDIKADGTVLVGTRGSEILEIKNWEEVESLVTGHFNGELWGLAIHPFQPFCATCGGDKTIRIWDLAQGTMTLAIKPLAQDMRAIDWSPDGALLVVGLMNGVILLLDASTLGTLSNLQSSFRGKDCWIQDIKFSPNSSKVAYGAHGGASAVEISGVSNNKLVKLYTINAGLTSALTHLDWSVDGSLVVVNSQAYELKFVNVEGKRNVSSSSVKTVEWQSWTCVLGWPVQYIWPEFADGTDINYCCKSHNGTVIATADDFGRVNLFRYPVMIPKQASKPFFGHSSHVTNVKFSHNDAFCVSTGGNDKCVFLWATDMAEAEPDIAFDEVKEDIEDIPSKLYIEERSLRRRSDEKKELVKLKVDNAIESNDPNAFFQFENVGQGDQFMAVKPWLGAIRAPSGWVKPPRNQNKPPGINLELEWVHGYRGKDCRNNVRYLPDGRIVYHAAGLGIIYNPQNHSQTFFNRHVDDITAFALSPNGNLVATGEVGRRPNIFVWDTASMMPVANFKQPLEHCIAAVAFSPSGTKLAAVAMDDDHSIAIYDLNAGGCICSTRGDREKIIDVAWVTENEFATIGVKHFKYWNLTGSQVLGKKGSFGRNNPIILCITVQGTNIFTGASNGTVIRWTGNAAVKSTNIHTRAVDSIWSSHSCIVTGGKDGFVHVLDNNLNKRQSFEMSAPQYESVSSLIRSAMLNESSTTLLVGTYGSEIYEIDIATGEATTITRGHYTPSRGTTVTNEVWGLDILPDNNHYVTSSDDGTLRLWSISERAQIAIVKFSENEEVPDSAKARCVGVIPDGSMLAVGFKDGSFKVLDTNSWNVRINKKDRKEEISDIKYSPNGKMLAVGSHDNFIDIYSVPDYRRISSCRGHSSYITHIDWSCDSRNLHSNCGAYELLFWEAATGLQLTAGATMLKDEPWYTWSCVIGWPVQGIYPPSSDGTDINATDRTIKKYGNNEYELVATADDFSMVKIYRYPCTEKGAQAVIGRGHSSHVTKVRFAQEDSYLISTGGDDQCVFQWKVIGE
jgi:microtubule-associated protein-like 6